MIQWHTLYAVQCSYILESCKVYRACLPDNAVTFQLSTAYNQFTD